VFHYNTSRKTSRELQGLGCISKAATSRLGLGDIRLGPCLGLSSEGLVHIPAVAWSHLCTMRRSFDRFR